jgi:methylmalonyl-CoA mutase
VKPIIPARGADEFEKLRLATERIRPQAPGIHAHNRRSAMRRARAQFSSNFFAVAGYEVQDNNGFESVADGVNAALEAKADIIVLCSSDEEYATVAREALQDDCRKRRSCCGRKPAMH